MSYALPYGVRVAGTWQSLTGPQVAANQIYANAGTGLAPGTTLNRPLTFAQNQVNVVVPGSVYGDRLNQIDLRFTKIVGVGIGRMDLNVDIYNAFNSDAATGYMNSYPGGNFAGQTLPWGTPTGIVSPRFARFSVQFDW